MFLPDVTNIRSPTTLAPVVSPTSCLIEPRYSTLGDITASGSGGTAAEAGGARHSSDSVGGGGCRGTAATAGGGGRRAEFSPCPPETQRKRRTCGFSRGRVRAAARSH